MEIRIISIHLSQSQILTFQTFIFSSKYPEIRILFHKIVMQIMFLNEIQRLMPKKHDKIEFFVEKNQKKCLRNHKLPHYTLNFRPDFLFDAVAEWSKASDLRSFGQKWEWGPGVKNFFFLFSRKKNFDLRLILFFTPFFKSYVTFLLFYMAIFLEMAPFFSYEPTVQ